MNNETWKKVEQIFHAALDLPVAERNSYLQRECAGDAVLFSEVESLLSSFEKKSSFLDEPVFELGFEAINGKPQKNLSGSVIGWYELQEKIGAGGMGEVYKAVDTRLNRRVALKFLCEAMENDKAAKRRLVKEARAIAMLEHPNICAVHGIEQSDEHHFIVMQYIEGKTLAECIDHQTITVEKFKALARQIFIAVAFAHSHGVIHRDLKPGNIMLTGDEQIKILDFGLAKIISQKQLFTGDSIEDISRFSQNGAVIGTVSYMSPEQLRGEKLDYRSDIFSVGIILYELLTKQNPFKHSSHAETIVAILHDEPPSLKESSLGFPANLINLVEKCLQKDKEKRFQSAAEILVELDKSETRNISKKILKRRQNRFVKFAPVAIILLALFASIFFYSFYRPQRTFAVLPISFDNKQIEKEYLADDLTQSIIGKLSKLSDLKVKNEYSVTRYKGKDVEPRTAGKELNVDAVFSGTIQNRAEGLILETKIIRTSDGVLIDSFDWQIDEADLTGLPVDITTRITSKIESRLTDDDKNKLVKKETESKEAKNYYINGRFYLKRRKGNDLKNAVDAFINAKDIDQNYAKAWAGLADAYLSLSAPGVKSAITPEEAVKSAKLAANRAIALDNTLCEAYNSLGLIDLKYDWNWKEAETYFRMAIDQDAEFVPARFGLISALRMQRRYAEAIREAEKIKELDPFSIASDVNIALTYYIKRDYEQMDRILSPLLQKFPDNMSVKYRRAYLFLKTEGFTQALEILEPIYSSNKTEDKISVAAPLGFAYAKMGRREEALKIIADLEEFRKNLYVPAQEKALIYVGLGDYDKVFENLSLSCAEKFSALPNWVDDPIVDEVKSDARFAKIRECVNL